MLQALLRGPAGKTTVCPEPLPVNADVLRIEGRLHPTGWLCSAAAFHTPRQEGKPSGLASGSPARWGFFPALCIRILPGTQSVVLLGAVLALKLRCSRQKKTAHFYGELSCNRKEVKFVLSRASQWGISSLKKKKKKIPVAMWQLRDTHKKEIYKSPPLQEPGFSEFRRIISVITGEIS